MEYRLPVYERLEKAIKKAGSQRALADKLGVSQQYLSDLKNGRRDPSEKILTALGLKRVVQYEAR